MCGIVGIASQTPVASELYDSLVQLQHRGQDAAGIITCDDYFHSRIDRGLVRDIFDAKDIQRLHGNMGIGHVRYPTAGSHSTEEAQPFRLVSPYGITLAHNGNLTNYHQLHHHLHHQQRRHLNTQNDSETLIHLFADGFSDQPVTDQSDVFFEQICRTVKHIHQRVQGSYSVVSCIIGKGLIAFRDPQGIRPLVIGKRTNAQGHDDIMIASETTPFSSLGFTSAGDIAPGEVIFIDTEGKQYRRQLTQSPFHPCVFEYVYFARPDAVLDDVSVYRARLRMGQNLAKRWRTRHPDILPDVVIPVPFSANTSALAFAHELGVRYSEGLYKNPFIGRTFIMPDGQTRKRSVRHKLSPQHTEIRGKDILLIDDSIVRGTTSKAIVEMVRECGAKKVYFASTCPPVAHPCFYGVDIPTKTELLANRFHSNEAIADYLGVDALLYQTETDLKEALERRGEYHFDHPCMACLNGCYHHKELSE